MSAEVVDLKDLLLEIVFEADRPDWQLLASSALQVLSATDSVVWTSVAVSLPDSDLTVNVTIDTAESGEPVWLGYLDGEQWRDVEGMPIKVTHWAPMLKGAV